MGLSDGAFFMIKHILLLNGNHPISSPICPMGVADTLRQWCLSRCRWERKKFPFFWVGKPKKRNDLMRAFWGRGGWRRPPSKGGPFWEFLPSLDLYVINQKFHATHLQTFGKIYPAYSFIGTLEFLSWLDLVYNSVFDKVLHESKEDVNEIHFENDLVNFCR